MKRQVKVSVGTSVGYSVSESVGEGAGSSATAATGLIDVYVDALAAFSTARRLRDNYAGALLRVRRSSDNAEQDIGFDAGTGLLDESALTTFVGANDGHVVTLYDQTTHGRNATQATAANQPRIVIAGVVQTLGTNNRPVARYETASSHQLATATYAHNTQFVSVFAAVRKGSDAVAAIPLGFGASGGGQNGSWRMWAPATDLGPNVGFQTQGNSNPAVATLASVTASINLVIAATAKHDGPPYTYNVRVNASLSASSTGSAVASGGTATSTFTTRALQFGNTTFAGVPRPFEGLIGEGVVYGTLARYSVSAGIDNNMMTFWGIGA